jgi:hypothetical protein
MHEALGDDDDEESCSASYMANLKDEKVASSSILENRIMQNSIVLPPSRPKDGMCTKPAWTHNFNLTETSRFQQCVHLGETQSPNLLND